MFINKHIFIKISFWFSIKKKKINFEKPIIFQVIKLKTLNKILNYGKVVIFIKIL